MGQTIVLTGMVLSAMPVGDYDKRIQLLTRERGKIAAFVRGARRPNSAFLASSNPFSFGEFEVYEGKSSYNVAKASITHYFRELAKDLDAVSYAFYFLEMASYYTQENMDGTDYLNLLYVTLKENLYYFSMRRHGTLCPDCLKGEYAVPLDASTLYALQYVITAPLQKLYSFTLSAPVLGRLEEITAGYIRQYQDHEFQSAQMLYSFGIDLQKTAKNGEK